jgi:pyridoxal phosphate enzyme (YggS family)
MTQFSLRLTEVTERILSACQRFGRNPEEITLLAVSKTQPAEAVREAADCGQRQFGENLVQEALAKMDATDDLALEWHFIGHLQSNKTRQVAAHFQWVQSVDREKIARRLDDQRPHHAPPLNVCIQVDIGSEPGKGGAEESRVKPLAELIATLPRLRLRGLMAIPPPSDDFDEQCRHFRQLRKLRDTLQTDGIMLDTLSMGMTGDMEAAIAEGSTMLRIGTALFGPRHSAE